MRCLNDRLFLGCSERKVNRGPPAKNIGRLATTGFRSFYPSTSRIAAASFGAFSNGRPLCQKSSFESMPTA